MTKTQRNKIIEYFNYYDLSPKEIAYELNLDEEAVITYLKRVQKKGQLFRDFSPPKKVVSIISKSAPATKNRPAPATKNEVASPTEIKEKFLQRHPEVRISPDCLSYQKMAEIVHNCGYSASDIRLLLGIYCKLKLYDEAVNLLNLYKKYNNLSPAEITKINDEIAKLSQYGTKALFRQNPPSILQNPDDTLLGDSNEGR